MKTLRIEVRFGEKRVAIERDLDAEMFSAARVDDLNKILIEMAESAADWWEDKSGATADKNAELVLNMREVLGNDADKFAEYLAGSSMVDLPGVRERLLRAGVELPVTGRS